LQEMLSIGVGNALQLVVMTTAGTQKTY